MELLAHEQTRMNQYYTQYTHTWKYTWTDKMLVTMKVDTFYSSQPGYCEPSTLNPVLHKVLYVVMWWLVYNTTVIIHRVNLFIPENLYFCQQFCPKSSIVWPINSKIAYLPHSLIKTQLQNFFCHANKNTYWHSRAKYCCLN